MVLNVFFIITFLNSVNCIVWNNIECPKNCICREEHFIDLPISRYTRHESYLNENQDFGLSNDVLYDETHFEEENPLVRTVTCILSSGENIQEFISKLPKDTQALTLINSANSINNTIKSDDFDLFFELISLEIIGSEPIDNLKNHFTFEIDTAIITLKYLNLEYVELKSLRSKEVTGNEMEDEIEVKLESITMIQKREKESEILPYYKYKEIQKSLENPVLSDFTNLILARLHGCNLQSIHWEMFDGLNSLKYLILENNNLKFIPNFAFYGTPNLKYLSLAWNNLLNIQITDLAGLLELEYLDLSHNNFSQLSELSFPPFPKLKVADFRNNPITVVYPNTFDIMNMTDSIILGGIETKLQLLPKSFLGLNKLLALTINNVDIQVLKQEVFIGMPVLKELVMTGNIQEIEFDAFIEVRQLEKLILSNCNIYNISMDSFYGLNDLILLDLSKNNLEYIPPNIFDQLKNLQEILLNGNKLRELPNGIFDKIAAKLVRLNDNPWHCSCLMSDWSPMMINKVKQKSPKICNSQYDKGISCQTNKNYTYIYENRVAPKCATPKKLENQTVFQAIRRKLHCKTNKLKYKKYKFYNVTKNIPTSVTKIPKKIEFVKNDLNALNRYKLDETKILTPNFDQDNSFKKNMLVYDKEYIHNKKKKQHILMMNKLKKTLKEEYDNNL